MTVNYSGWKSMKKIKIVYSDRMVKINGKSIPKAYVVDASDNKQLNSAINWASGYSPTRAEPKIIETTNENFNFSLASAADCSDQGGKLSFWMCHISKEDIPDFLVGINTDILIKILLKSTFINGVCNNKVIFARHCGQLGVLHTEMSEYIDLINDQKARNSVSQRKTKKWEIGYEYITLTTSDTYLGNFLDFMSINRINTYAYNMPKYEIEINSNKITKPIYICTNKDKMHDNDITYIINWAFVYCNGPSFKDSLPARQRGDKILEESTLRSTIVDSLIDQVSNNTNLYNNRFIYDIYSVFSVYDTHPEATRKMLNILKQHVLNNTNGVADNPPSYTIIKDGVKTTITSNLDLINYFINLAK